MLPSDRGKAWGSPNFPHCAALGSSKAEMGKRRKTLAGQKVYADYHKSILPTSACPEAQAQSLEEFLKETMDTGPMKGRNNAGLLSWVKQRVITVKGGSKSFLAKAHEKRKQKVSSKLRGTLKPGYWRKSKGLDKLDKVPYSVLFQVHELWLSYAQDAMNMYRRQEDAVLEMDMHGALLHVMRARNPLWVGLEGLVLKDERETFEIVSQTGRRSKVRKKGTQFGMEIGDVKVLIDGTNFYSIQTKDKSSK